MLEVCQVLGTGDVARDLEKEKKKNVVTPWDFHDSESMRPSLKLRDYSVGLNRR